MPKDAYTIYRAGIELDLSGARIDKVNMPDRETVFLSLRQGKERFKLVLSCAAQNARCHITKQSAENPTVAFGMLMHLRKHIQGGTITATEFSPAERVITVKISAYNDLSDRVNYSLIVELTGKVSNIILVDENGNISDAAKRVPLDMNNARAILPSLPYTLPPRQERADVFNPLELKRLVAPFKPLTTYDAMRKCVAGLAPLTIDEVFYRANLDKLSLCDDEQIDAFVCAAQEMYKIKAEPTVTVVDGKPKDYFVFPYHDLGGELIKFETMNDALDFYYSRGSESARWAAISKPLHSALKSARNKAEKRLSDFTLKQEECADLETDRIKGEILTANIYKLKDIKKSVELDNWYDGTKIKINLDPKLNAQQNASKYFKSYAKKKRALVTCEQMIQDAHKLIERLDEIDDSFRLCSTYAELDEIQADLAALHLVPPKNKKKAVAPSKPLTFDIDGYRMYVGKNSAQNDRLTRNANPEYIWLHTQKIHGSHGIIESAEVPESVLKTAAEICAFYSKAYASDNVPVDYTTKKYVKFERGAPLGRVVYTNYKTLFVTPNNGDKFKAD